MDLESPVLCSYDDQGRFYQKYKLNYSGPSDIRMPDIRTLQYPDNYSWEQIFLTLFCLIYPEFRIPDLDLESLFLPQNAYLHYILVHLSGR